MKDIISVEYLKPKAKEHTLKNIYNWENAT